MERSLFERDRTGGYELIYPSECPEVNHRYELFIQKANELWDDFTTGSKGHKPQKQLVVKSNTQQLTAKKNTPVFKKAVTVVNPKPAPPMHQTAKGECQSEMTAGASSTTQSTRITSGKGKKKIEERQLSSSRTQMKVVSNPFDSNPYGAMT